MSNNDYKSIYIGIDPSFNGFTSSRISNDKLISYHFFDIRKLKNRKDITTDISYIVGQFNGWNNKYKSSLEKIFYSIEHPFYNRSNPKVFASQMRLYQSMIENLLLCNKYNNGLHLIESEPKKIKKFFTGNGNATKDQMFEALKNDRRWEKYYNKKIFYKLEDDQIEKCKLKKEGDKLRLEREGLVDAIAIALYGKYKMEEEKDAI